jgi:hypothetical protein
MVLAVGIDIRVAHQQPADALAELLEAPGAAGDANDRRIGQGLRPRT